MIPRQAADGGLVYSLAVQIRMMRKPDISDFTVWLFPSTSGQLCTHKVWLGFRGAALLSATPAKGYW
jgi:hypothetical protein